MGLLDNSIGMRQLMVSCRRMGTGLRAGLDVRRVLEQEKETGSNAYRRHSSALYELTVAGTSYSEAVAQQGTYFPPLYRAMVKVGERGGKLPEVLLRLADHYEHMLTLRRNFLIGIAWPIFELTLALFVIGILIFVIGILGADIDLFGIGSGWSGVRNYITLLGIVAFVSLFVYRLITTEGPLAKEAQRIAMRIPLLGNAIVAETMARMTWSMAMIADSDMASRMIAKTALQSTGNVYYLGCASQIDEALKQGKEMHEAFQNTDAFPADFIQALKTGELSGTMVETLNHLSRDYDNRAQAAWKTLSLVAAVAMFGLVAMIIIFFIYQVFTKAYLNPMNDILNDIQNNKF